MVQTDTPQTHSDEGFLNQNAVVGVRTVQLHPQGSGKSRLRIAGVGARMVRTFPPGRNQGLATGEADPHPGGQSDQQHGQSGRKKISHIVNPSRRSAKKELARILVPHHRIQGINHFVGYGQRRPADGGKKKR